MKFRVERDALADAVAWTAKSLPSRPSVPVLAGVLLRVGDNRLQVSGFDYEVSSQVTVDVQADADGNFTVSDLPPGEYRIEWKYETSGTPPSDGVDIGTALSVGHITVNLSSGTNTVSIPLTK